MLELIIAIAAAVGVGVCLVIQAREIARLRVELARHDSCREPTAPPPKPKRWLTGPPQSHAQPYPEQAESPLPRVFRG